MAVAFAAPKSLAEPSSSCEDISKDVTAAIQKDPAKVLMIVEDALVINETCACEIIKAAILASKADASLVNQIVQTGISVAPKMSGVIADCATAVAPGANVTGEAKATVQQLSGKSAKNVVDKNPLPVAPEEEEFTSVPSSIRGIYLMQPPPSGYPPRKCHNNSTSPCVCTP